MKLETQAKTIYEIPFTNSTGETTNLSFATKKVILVVNVASQCGLTPQYKGLEELYQKYKNQDFIIVGFPCNQFGGQEPGTNEEIQNFCQLNFGVSFPIMAKIDVNGDNTAPLFKYLKEKSPGFLGTELIKWNFTKFLINKKGDVIERFSPQTEPKSIESAIEKNL